MSPRDERESRPDRVVVTSGQYEALFGWPIGTGIRQGDAPAPIPAVAPDDPLPDPTGTETDVWLTEWQVAEDGFDVAVGERVDWALTTMDQQWIRRLLGDRRTVPLHRDTYADAPSGDARQSARHDLSGVVTRIDQVSVRFVGSDDPADGGGLVPECGGAHQHSVSALSDRRPHHGSITGWIVRVRP